MTPHERFTARGAALLIVDIQEKLVPRMRSGARMVAHAERLILVARILGIPTFATEQYPKGLGPTIARLQNSLPTRFEKTSFQALGADGLEQALEDHGIRHVTLCGIETHVCIAQTAIELLGRGYRVQVPADAVSSRQEFDEDFALRRIERAGGGVTTSEAVLFEWLEGSDHPAFREVSHLIKTFPSPDLHGILSTT